MSALRSLKHFCTHIVPHSMHAVCMAHGFRQACLKSLIAATVLILKPCRPLIFRSCCA